MLYPRVTQREAGEHNLAYRSWLGLYGVLATSPNPRPGSNPTVFVDVYAYQGNSQRPGHDTGLWASLAALAWAGPLFPVGCAGEWQRAVWQCLERVNKEGLKVKRGTGKALHRQYT